MGDAPPPVSDGLPAVRAASTNRSMDSAWIYQPDAIDSERWACVECGATSAQCVVTTVADYPTGNSLAAGWAAVAITTANPGVITARLA